MATNEILEIRNLPDEIKRNFTTKDLAYLQTCEEYFQFIDDMFDKIRNQIYHGLYIGIPVYIPYSAFENLEYIKINLPDVLIYYKNAFYNFIHEDIIPLFEFFYSNTSIDNIEDVPIVSEYFDTFYNLLFGSNYDNLSLNYLEDIKNVLQYGDYDTAIKFFDKYFSSIVKRYRKLIEDIDKNLKELKNKNNKDNIACDLYMLYLSLKNANTDTLASVITKLNKQDSNSIINEISNWINDVLAIFRKQITDTINTRDIIIATFNNPHKRDRLREIILQMP